MRILLSRHGQALKHLISHAPEQEQKEYPYLEDRLGHKVSEVIAGAAVGIVATLVLIAF